MSPEWTPWTEWIFSPSLRARVDEFTAKLRDENRESLNTNNWLYVKDFKFESSASQVDPNEEVLSQGNESSYDVDGLVASTVESIESSSTLEQCKYADIPTKVLTNIFSRVQVALSETGFSNFCKVVSSWQDPKLLSVCFDCVILNKLKDKEEAALPTISLISELAKSKPKLVSKCIIQLLTSIHFTDEELLQQVFVTLPDSEKDAIIMTLVDNDNFKETNWNLLQVLTPNTTNSSQDRIIMLMNSKCEEYASNQMFARLLVSLCKNLQSDSHREMLMKIIEKNKTLLKRQALKYLTSS